MKDKTLTKEEIIKRNPIDKRILADIKKLRCGLKGKAEGAGYTLTSPFSKPSIAQPKISQIAVPKRPK